MKNISLLLLAFLFGAGTAFASEPGNCITCHQDWEDEDGPSFKFARDIHNQRGLGCEDCHGGDPSLEDMDEVSEHPTYRGVPDHLEVPDFCARCHSDAAYMHEHNPSLPVDQLAKYRTSVHGQKLFQLKDRKVANCISCHSVHEIADERLPYSSTHPLNLASTCGTCHADAEYMEPYNIPTDQLQAYRESVHGQALLERKDLGAPTCNDCHGNHGAAPPDVSSLAAICGFCHTVEAELFAMSPHADAFEENELPMCETCHSNHRILKPHDGMVGTTEPALCVKCHDKDDGTRGFAMADSVLTCILNLAEARASSAELLNEARSKGMMVTDEEFAMKDVDQLLIQTRTLIHAFNVDSVSSKARSGIAKADSVRVSSAELIDEYYFRRKGLGVATLIITFLAVMLYRKIRTLR